MHAFDRPLRRRLRLALSLALLPVACQTAPSLALPEATPLASWRPAAETSELSAAASELPARGLVAMLFAVMEPPTGTPVALAASVISSNRGAPFRGRSRLPVGTLWLDDAATRSLLRQFETAPPQQVQSLGSVDLFVAGGLIATVRVADTPLPLVELRTRGTTVDVQLVSSIPQSPQTGLTPSTQAPQTAAAPTAAEHDDESSGLERLTLAASFAENATAALFVPADAMAGAGYLLVLLPGPPPPTELVAAQRQQPATDGPVGESDAATASWQVAMRAIGEHKRRPALLAVFGRREIARAVDLVLAADERLLIEITATLRGLPDEAREQPWALERALWIALLPRIERDDLTGALRAALVRQLGALGDDPSTLSLLLDTCADGTVFGAALQEENAVALDDRSAAARVIACDWLRAHGATVADYDPLADQASRRAALQAHRVAAATTQERSR